MEVVLAQLQVLSLLVLQNVVTSFLQVTLEEVLSSSMASEEVVVVESHCTIHFLPHFLSRKSHCMTPRIPQNQWFALPMLPLSFVLC